MIQIFLFYQLNEILKAFEQSILYTYKLIKLMLYFCFSYFSRISLIFFLIFQKLVFYLLPFILYSLCIHLNFEKMFYPDGRIWRQSLLSGYPKILLEDLWFLPVFLWFYVKIKFKMNTLHCWGGSNLLNRKKKIGK